jgi:transposase-like protein
VGENRRNRCKFTDEFKRDAVKLVHISGKPIAQIAQELGI